MAATAAIIGLGVSAGSSIGGGIAANQAAKRDARRLERLGEIDANEARLRGSKLRSAQRVAFAKGGVSLQAGTPLDVFAESAGQVELNALRRRARFREEAAAQRAGGKSALTGGITSGIGTLLGGGAQLQRLGVIGNAPPGGR
jgi:hypothetical protein